MEYKAQYQEYLLQATAALDAASARFLPEESEVCRAARYSLLGGGKRIRAILTLSVCDMLGGEMQVAAQFAAAVEMLHCYSLIHDDLPCMDNDDLRRGRPSCHKAFSESTAMLAGDVLLTEAFEVIANASATPQICVAAARALARYLTHLRTTTAYYDAKDNVRSFLDGVPLIGTPMKKSLIGAKTLVRRAMYHSTMFEDMGFEYIGPVDGHNVEELERTLRSIYQRPGPHFLHIVTKKGKGYQPAEMNPGNYHGVSAFDPDGMPDPEVAPKESFSTVFGKLLVQEGTQNPKLCAITAAMKYGTGLQFFAHRHPQRFFDVGMAEQHAVTFAAGLASQGMLPVVCIYSTFLQRSYDQIIHDVNLLKENVVFAIDRAGFVPADGETHQGIYDAAFLSQIGIPVYAPSNYEELQYWLHYLLQDTVSGPRAIRYPRGGESAKLAQYPCTKREYDFLYETPGAEILLVSYADELEDILEAANQLNAASQNADVLRLVKLYPFTDKLIDTVSKYKIVLFAEECVAAGGIGEHLAYALQQKGWNGRFLHCAVHTACLPHATVPQIKQCTGLDAADLVQAVRSALTKGEHEL